jgi:hypothetical protein
MKINENKFGIVKLMCYICSINNKKKNIMKNQLKVNDKTKMEITHLTLTNNTRVEVLNQLSKHMFKVSYGKDTKGNDVIGIVHSSIVLLFN